MAISMRVGDGLDDKKIRHEPQIPAERPIFWGTVVEYSKQDDRGGEL
jgi:hypothetical protein